MRKSKIPTIIGVILLLAGVAAGVFLIQNQQIFKLGAAPESEPKNVRITNITGHSFAVSWVTDKKTSGFIKYGEEGSFNQTDLDEISGQNYLHYLTVKGLTPQTAYTFKINSGGDDYDNNGAPWQVTTGPELAQPTSTNIISGSVLTATGEPAKNVIVYVTAASASPLSVYTSENGSWLINLSQARTQDLSSYSTISNQNTLLEISVQAAERGVSSAQVYPQSAKPVPAMTLGDVHDFKNLPPSDTDEIPEATLDLPTQEATEESKFDVEGGESQDPSSVTLESVDDGEVITSTKPEFFGEGPAGTKITITVESEPITQDLTIGSNGSWSWSPPSNLEKGSHKITISWRDATGVLRTLTRTFVVQAAEGPAFESTPSASPTSSPSPTSTSTPSPSPSATPSPTASATAQPYPESGSLTPTYLLSIMGLGLLFLSGIATYLAFQKE
jgi:hypothetical protein